MNNHASLLNNNITLLHEWLNDLTVELKFEEKSKDNSFALLRAVLHELRSELPLENLVYFSAQLPVFIKGVLFENWNPNLLNPKERKLGNFLSGIREKLPNNLKDVDLEENVKLFFDILRKKINYNAVDKLKTVLSKQVKELFQGNSIHK
jgi:uncharacterized protein (DUF2267 family)